MVKDQTSPQQSKPATGNIMVPIAPCEFGHTEGEARRRDERGNVSPINLLIGAIMEHMLGNKWKIFFFVPPCLSLCLFLLYSLPSKVLSGIHCLFSFLPLAKEPAVANGTVHSRQTAPWHSPPEKRRALRWQRAVEIVS